MNAKRSVYDKVTPGSGATKGENVHTDGEEVSVKYDVFALLKERCRPPSFPDDPLEALDATIKEMRRLTNIEQLTRVCGSRAYTIYVTMVSLGLSERIVALLKKLCLKALITLEPYREYLDAMLREVNIRIHNILFVEVGVEKLIPGIPSKQDMLQRLLSLKPKMCALLGISPYTSYEPPI